MLHTTTLSIPEYGNTKPIEAFYACTQNHLFVTHEGTEMWDIHSGTQQQNFICHPRSGFRLVAASSSLADLFENCLVGHLAEVAALNLGVDTWQGAAKSVFGGGVNHFGPHKSVVGSPGKEADLGPLSLSTAKSVLKVVYSEPAVVRRKLAQEVLVVVVFAGRLDFDAALVVGKPVNDVFHLLFELEVLEGRDTIRSKPNTRARHDQRDGSRKRTVQVRVEGDRVEKASISDGGVEVLFGSGAG